MSDKRTDRGLRDKALLSLWLAVLCTLMTFSGGLRAAAPASAFQKEVQPLLSKYCYDCHGDGMSKGNVAFDGFKTEAELVANHDLWLEVLKNVRAGIMPPPKKDRPSAEELHTIEQWVKNSSFKLDAKQPDPGRVTVRRLNRVEYHNTIRDLIGIDFNTDQEFPPDDTGHGFDNIGDVLTLSPMLLEKYLAAAKAIVTQAVPAASAVPAEHLVTGIGFHHTVAGKQETVVRGGLSLSYYEAATVTNVYLARYAGAYQLVVDLTANEKFVDNVFDYNKCRLVFKVDGKELWQQELVREGGKPIRVELDQDWQPGAHKFTFELTPLTPDEKQVRALSIRIGGITVRGPLSSKYWVAPKNYLRFFPKTVPADSKARRAFARELLQNFAVKAFRQPVDPETAERLAGLAESIYQQPKQTFESGIAQAMVAVLASPRFLFREEGVEPVRKGEKHPLVNEYALASRLSYLLWSSMPDEELFELASQGKLRTNMLSQVKRMLAHPRASAFTQNFSGQWLQTRDITSVQIDARSVLNRDETPSSAGGRQGGNRGAFGRPRVQFDDALRNAMQRETEKYFAYVVHEDRSLLELIESDYTFLNEPLARHYGLTNLNVKGTDFRKVTLPADSPRGGVLTQGTILAVTSNPTRTSPVKRGLFILENFLGTPPPPPPPNIPALEDSKKEFKDQTPTLRETLEIHRANGICSSCHNRMDPLGLALEGFNAMGMERQKDAGQPIDASGKLITGEPFKDIRDVKHILATKQHLQFYRTIAEKMLIYALGRGLEYYDLPAVDDIVERLEKNGGHFSALLLGVVESAPFQKRRELENSARADASETAVQGTMLARKP